MTVETEDETLPVAAARAGDPAAWDALFRRYQLPLYAYARELLRDDQTALDVVQETFLSAVRHVASLRDESRFGSWLFGIAHQRCQQHGGRRGREARWLVVDLPDEERDDLAAVFEEPDPQEWLVRREQEAEFFQRLAGLPEAHRAVLLLRFVGDFPLEEIAVITGVPLGTEGIKAAAAPGRTARPWRPPSPRRRASGPLRSASRRPDANPATTAGSTTPVGNAIRGTSSR